MRYWLFLLLFLPFYSYAADQNGYTSVYESRSGNTQDSQTNVDVDGLASSSCDQIIETGTSWSSINWSNTVICLRAGNHKSKGTLTLGSSGTSGTRKILRCVTSGGGQCSVPVSVSVGNRAVIKKLVFDGDDYWIVDKITADGDGANDKVIEFVDTSISGNASTFNILNNILAEDGGGNTESLVQMCCGNTQNTLQNSVVRDSVVQVGQDNDCIITGQDTDNRVVNNELYNCNKGWGNFEGGNSAGAVVENNDIYVETSRHSDCSGNYTTSGPCSTTEDGVAFKRHATSSNTAKVIHNRIWGWRQSDNNLCCGSGTQGAAVSAFSGDNEGSPDQGSDYILFQNNIIMDSQLGYQWTGTLQSNDNNSFIGNIVYNITDFRSTTNSYGVHFDTDAANNEFYLNTFISVKGDGFASFWSGVTNLDWRCNINIDNTAKTGTAGTGSQFDYNVYYGTTDLSETNKVTKTITLKSSYTGCTTLGCTANENTSGLIVGDVVRTSSDPVTDCTSNNKHCYLYKVTSVGSSGQIQAIRGPFSFYRKLKTSPQQIFIPYARPHSSAVEAGFCPSGFASRNGIGVDNTQP